MAVPVNFLTAEQSAQYGRYAGEPSTSQLAQYFFLDDADRVFLRPLRQAETQWGCAVQLGTVRFLGTFVDDPENIPANIGDYLAAQLGLAATPNLRAYVQTRVHWDHQRRIIAHYHYASFDAQPQHWRLTRWLYTRAWTAAERPSLLFDQTTAYLLDRKILLPGVTTLTRLVAQVRDRAQLRLWRRLAAVPDESQRNQLESWVQAIDPGRPTPLDQLRHPPTRISRTGFRQAAERLDLLQTVDPGRWDLHLLPTARLQALARFAATARAQTVERLTPERRVATLVAFATVFHQTAQDDFFELFDRFLSEHWSRATRQQAQSRLRTLRDLDAAAKICRDACTILLQEDTPDARIRDAIWATIPKATLQAAVATIAQVTQSAAASDEQQAVETLYPLFRPVMAWWREHLIWEATPTSQAVLERWNFVRAHWGETRSRWQTAPTTGLTAAWRAVVCDETGRIHPAAYTVWTVQAVWDALRRHDLYNPGSVRYGDPRAQLLHGPAWDAAKPHMLRTLGWAVDPAEALTPLAQALDAAYRQTAAHWADNPAVRLESGAIRPRVVLTPLDRLEESAALRTLRPRVDALLPAVALPELLLEVHQWTGFADAFTHVSEGGDRIQDLALSICAVLLTQACNIGWEPVVNPAVPALARDRLAWVAQNYIRAETLAAANATLVDYHGQLPLAQSWGSGDVASADGMRFVVPVRTLHAGSNPKYFGMGRGVTYYNFVSDQFSGFHALVVPGTLRDSLVVLEGLLEQTSSLHPHEIMTDTAGYSDIIFGLFGLLGYQFSPRLADVGEARFWRIAADGDYGVLNDLAHARIRWDLIQRHWEDMLRVAGSLKWGAVNATALIQTLHRGGRPTVLGRAIGELGRIYKTRYLLAYLDDAGYRRRILTQLNRGEARHSLARAAFYGKRGELHQAYREGQEDQLNALGLVVNAMVLWNTRYMGVAVDALREDGVSIDQEDLGRLSPLSHDHITMLGQYSFQVPESVAQGRLRPLMRLTRR
ncbi:Tn3 family transposase [Sulfobacillus thermotolerans]|uniref:Tn3 family transposase n=1 Tax=Sulfobacillus thermotolerans TaxID=338644 RepID=UPI003D300ACE